MRKLNLSMLGLCALIYMGFTYDEASATQKTCEYEFYVKCKNSNQFVDVIRAKDASTAKTMCTNKYANCKVSTKNTNGKNCK